MRKGKLNIVVVEDEAIIADHIMQSLRTIGYQPWGPAMTYDEAVGYIDRGPVDLVLVDINLNGKHDGIRLGDFLKARGRTPHIFLTANTDAATVEKAKGTMPMGFIVKPFRREELYTNIQISLSNWDLIQKSLSHTQSATSKEHDDWKNHSLILPVNGKKRRIFINEIMSINSAHVYVELFMRNGETILVRSSMQQVHSSLPPKRFIRIHRGHIVNLSYIDEFDGHTILIGGNQLPVSRGKRNQLSEHFSSL